MEKRRPHYSLASIKATFSAVDALRMSDAASDCALALGIDRAGVVGIIQAVTQQQFYKSMTSHVDHRVWQDVYHVPLGAAVLYVKFTTDALGFFVISFKEK